MIHQKTKNIFVALLAGSLLSACGNINPESSSDDLLTLSGQFSQSIGSQKIAQSLSQSVVLTEYELYCVTFTSPAYSAVSSISSQGDFSLRLPKQKAFGCFVNEKSSNQTVASLVVQGAGQGYASTNSNTMALNGNLVLPNLELDLASGEVLVDESAIADVSHELPVGLDLNDLHNQTYAYACGVTGNADADAECQDWISDSDNDQSVFFRVLEAEYTDGSRINGLGIWAGQDAFDNCGSIDMNDSRKASIEADEDFTFLQVASAPNFVSDTNLCETRDGNPALEQDQMEDYYGLGPIHSRHGAWVMEGNESDQVATGCEREEEYSVSIQADNADRLVGVIHFSTRHIEDNPGDCGSREDEEEAHLLEFTRQ